MPSATLPPSISDIAAMCSSTEELLNQVKEFKPEDASKVETAT